MQVDGLRSGTELRRVSVHGAPADPLRARQRLERALATVDWTPPQLPPRAVLVVRRLVVGAPSRKDFGLHVTKALRQRADVARRPWLHADAVSAEAVIFADEAELFACLIRDWLRGVVADRWWWRDVLRGATAEDWLRRYALPRGDVLVPALSLLEPRREVVPSIARLTDSDARIAVRSVARAFALPSFDPFEPPFGMAAPAATDRVDAPAAPIPQRAAGMRDRASALSRLIAAAPEVEHPTLGLEQRRLVGVVMATLRVPSWTRSPEFAIAVAALESIAVLDDPPTTASRDDVPSTTRHRDEDAAVPRASMPRASSQASNPQSSFSTDRAGTVELATPEPPTQIRRTNQTAPSELEPAEKRRERDRHAEEFRDAPNRPASASAVAASPAVAPLHDDVPLACPRQLPAADGNGAVVTAAAGAWCETQYGGIFYLLNAWLAMGVYADFTAPRAHNLALSPWNLLALAGRAWFDEHFTGDSLWTVLADLAMRRAEDDPDHERVLPDRWLEHHLDELTTRLHLALGCEHADDVHGILCCHRARVDTSASSVHVHLALSELPLEIRIAGLDRDPGWIPAAGRAVSFHFD